MTSVASMFTINNTMPSDVKTSRIVLNPSIKTAMLEDGPKLQYHDIAQNVNMEDAGVLDTLSKDIERMDKDDHKELYRTIRKHKPASFFAMHSMGTCFNLSALDVKARWDLYTMVQMCKNHKERSKVVSAAETEYRGVINLMPPPPTSTHNNMGASPSMPVMPVMPNGKVNPTEDEKIVIMKALNVKNSARA